MRALWVRPANLPLDALARAIEELGASGGEAEVFTGRPDAPVVAGLRALEERASGLWGLPRLAQEMREQIRVLEASRRRVPSLERRAALIETLTTGAAAFRLVARDPLLPIEILPDDWPGEDLRARIVAYNHLGCDVWATVPNVSPTRNPHPRDG